MKKPTSLCILLAAVCLASCAPGKTEESSRTAAITLPAGVTRTTLSALPRPTTATSTTSILMLDNIKITADEFAALFAENPEQAARDNMDKVFELTGVYTAYQTGKSFSLSTEKGEYTLLVSITPGTKPNIPAFAEPGSTIRLVARFHGIEGKTLLFSDAQHQGFTKMIPGPAIKHTLPEFMTSGTGTYQTLGTITRPTRKTITK